MSDFLGRICQNPRAHDPDRGAETRATYGSADPALAEVLVGAGGSSPYLYGLIQKEVDWLREALAGAPEEAWDRLISVPQDLEPARVVSGLREVKRRAALLIGLADLAGVWDLGAVTAALTALADVATHRALEAGLAPVLRRGLIPGLSEEDAASGAGLSVLAMGKMGAGELNYSSDIDLICLFDDSRFDPGDLAQARTGYVKAVRAMAKILSEPDADGYVFRTDLRLRPDAAVTPVAMSMTAAERYYEAQGRTWERAAFIKARAAAGDITAGEAFLEALTPFVWRRHLDFWAIEDAHAMRLKIRDAKGLHGKSGHLDRDLKLGEGGIREIEFFAQTRQLIAGGRDLSLRSPRTVEALGDLAEAGWITPEDATVLTNDYTAHRALEHRVQMIADQQTHTTPKSEDDFARLAALAGKSSEDLAAEVDQRMTRVHEVCEGFFSPSKPSGQPVSLPENFDAVVQRWPDYPALRSDRAREIFQRVRLGLLKRLANAADPTAALLHFDGFLAGLPAGVQVFSLFDANPQLLDLVVDIADTAPALAGYLSRNAAVFDAVIAGTFFAEWPGRSVLVAHLGAALGQADAYEAKLDAARVWAKEWHFRTGVHHLRRLISGDEAGYQYADLARAVLEALWPVVVDNFAVRHGPPPGRGAAIIGMGSLGAGTLTATSDLDLIVVFDPDGSESSEGAKPLPATTYYARLTQAFVTALTAPTSEGRLYEVDMRLRPSGRKGPVATALSAFVRYQSEEAWTWEHLALTRARPVAGSERLMGEVEAFRRDLIQSPHARSSILNDIMEMRTRLFNAKPATEDFDPKLGPGGMQDIELFASMGALLAGAAARGVRRQLLASREALGIDTAALDDLVALYARQSAVRQATNLIGGAPVPGSGAAKLMIAAAEIDTLDALRAALKDEAAAAASVIARALTNH